MSHLLPGSPNGIQWGSPLKESHAPQRRKHVAVVGKYAPLNEPKQNYEQYDALIDEALEIDQLYIIGSFNSWLPMPMI